MENDLESTTPSSHILNNLLIKKLILLFVIIILIHPNSLSANDNYLTYTKIFPWVGPEGEAPEVVFTDLIRSSNTFSVYEKMPYGNRKYYELSLSYDIEAFSFHCSSRIYNNKEYKIKVYQNSHHNKGELRKCISDRNPQTIIVDINGTGNYTTIQEGIDNSVNGDTVLVYPGTYYENVNYAGKNITLTSLFFSTKDFSYIDSTIISGHPFGGSVVSFTNGEDSTAILCDFTISNGYADFGGGIYCSGSNPSLKNLIISENTANNKGAGIYCLGSSPSLNNVTISNNIANDSGGGLCSGCESCPTLEDCILWNNTPQEIYLDTNGSVTVTYSDIQGGWSGVGNISDDPRFTDPDNGDYSLTWNDTVRSPCIDTGNPNIVYNDFDGTRADMGAIPAITHNYDSRILHEGWNWFSFPVLDTLSLQADTALTVLAPILDPDILTEVLFESYEPGIWWNVDHWENEIGDFRSVEGYKIQMNTEAELPISGFLEDSDAVITLEAEAEYGNWIGYFLGYSQMPHDAFTEVWDTLTYIKAEDWAMFKKQGQWWGAYGTVDYGKSYVVGCSENCSFTWGLGLEEYPYTKSETIVFSYQEQADYMTIFVDSTEAVAGIDEIGVFLGDECIGASVIEEFPVFIPAYIEDEDSIGTKEDGELAFQVATYSKKEKRIIPAFVYHNLIDAFVKEPIILDNKSYAIVRLGTGEGIEFPKEFTLYQNYPNPITSSTTISFIPSPGVEKSEIKMYNIKGQLVREFLNVAHSPSLPVSVAWDGKDDNGKQLGNGIYFYKVISGKKSAINKMVLMH